MATSELGDPESVAEFEARLQRAIEALIALDLRPNVGSPAFRMLYLDAYGRAVAACADLSKIADALRSVTTNEVFCTARRRLRLHRGARASHRHLPE